MKCFKQAVIAALKWREIERNVQRISKLRQHDDLDWDGINFPVSTRDIKRFESRNGISVNVLALDGKTPYFFRKGGNYVRSAGEAHERAVNLMSIEDNEKSHYVAIKSLGRLLSMQNSKHKESQHFCTNCLQGFAEQLSRDEHYAYCRSSESVRIEMPTKHPIVEYSNGQHQLKVPNVSSTRGVNVHTPSGWCLRSKFAYGNVDNPLTQYRGSDCVERFCENIISEAK